MSTTMELSANRDWGIARWLPAAAFPAAAVWLGHDLPAWIYMWVLAFGVYASLKWLTFVRVTAAGRQVSTARGIGYLLFWPGMDAEAFLSSERPTVRPTSLDSIFAAAKAVLGVALFVLVAPMFFTGQPWSDWIAAWIAMTGVAFVLHFGLIHLLALAWQAAGVAARPIMQAPICATSLADFWGRRWNHAFRDFGHVFVFRPTLRRHGGAAATMAVFAVSGVIHDTVISLAARGGYGWPTLYFLVQGCALLFERSRVGRWMGLGRGWRGWAFAAVVIVAPVDWLFHSAFRHEVVLPMLSAVSAGQM